MPTTPAHDQTITHRYLAHYPEHEPRDRDPHYVDFQAFRRRTQKTAQCHYGLPLNDFTDCHGGLELHHSHIEFAIMNGVDLKHLEHVYPGVSNRDQVGAWVESADNLVWLCERHHRDVGAGVHDLSASDYEGSRFTDAIFGAIVATDAAALSVPVTDTPA
jgi:hypothetical protein